jgi:hypothetical protein
MHAEYIYQIVRERNVRDNAAYGPVKTKGCSSRKVITGTSHYIRHQQMNSIANRVRSAEQKPHRARPWLLNLLERNLHSLP